MITTEKRFGSYVLKKIDYEDILQSNASTLITNDNVNTYDDRNYDDGSEIDSSPGVTDIPLKPSGSSSRSSSSGSSSSVNCSIPSEWTSLELLSIDVYNHDTSIFTFQLPIGRGIKYLNLPAGGFLLVLGPNCDHDGGHAIRPYTSISDDYYDNRDKVTGSFKVLCKRYNQWGVKESIQTNFLFTRTNHSYRPPGALSNYIHRLNVGDHLQFKFTSLCHGKLAHDESLRYTREVMMIAVGVGVAPMIQILRTILRASNADDSNIDGTAAMDRPHFTADQIKRHMNAQECFKYRNVKKVVLLYGVRTVSDILLKDELDAWQAQYPLLLKIVYCVGSRWTNIHWGAKNQREYIPPPLPTGFDQLNNAELGWVNEEKIRKHGFPPSENMKVIVCGLPGVYDKLCGSRESSEVAVDSVLHKLGYSSSMVIKL